MGIQEDICQAIEDSEATLYRVAKDCELDYATLYRFFHGQSDARVSTIERLASYLGLRLESVDKVKGKGARRNLSK